MLVPRGGFVMLPQVVAAHAQPQTGDIPIAGNLHKTAPFGPARRAQGGFVPEPGQGVVLLLQFKRGERTAGFPARLIHGKGQKQGGFRLVPLPERAETVGQVAAGLYPVFGPTVRTG